MNATSTAGPANTSQPTGPPIVATAVVTVSLTAADEVELKQVLTLKEGDRIDAFLQAAAQTATDMFVDELLGRTDYPSKVAARQTRLLKLVEYAFGSVLPSPTVVGGLFHISESSATALLSSTAARYRRALREPTQSAVRQALLGKVVLIANQEKKERNPKYRFYCVDDQVIRSMRQALRRQGQAVASVAADPENVGTYVLRLSTLAALEDRFGLTVEQMTTPLLPSAGPAAGRNP